MTSPTSSEWDLLVCEECADVVGPLMPSPGPPMRESLIQRGTCPAHKAPEEEDLWKGFYFNRHTDLCHCCGIEARSSGHPFCVWFCDDCKQRVLQLNAHHGRCVIPIGRHSVHCGVMLSGKEALRPGAIEIFLERWHGVAEAMEALGDWHRKAVRMNLRAIGLTGSSVMPLQDYCSMTSAVVDPRERFREMCEYLAGWVSPS